MPLYKVSVTARLIGGNRIVEVLLPEVEAETPQEARDKAKACCKPALTKFVPQGRKFTMERIVGRPLQVGDTIEITQDGRLVGGDLRLVLGARFYIVGHRFKSWGNSGVLGVWKLQPVRGTGKAFETTWLRAKLIRLAPVECPGCHGPVSPNPDGSFNRHGSLGWSCDGKVKRSTT